MNRLSRNVVHGRTTETTDPPRGRGSSPLPIGALGRRSAASKKLPVFMRVSGCRSRTNRTTPEASQTVAGGEARSAKPPVQGAKGIDPGGGRRDATACVNRSATPAGVGTSPHFSHPLCCGRRLRGLLDVGSTTPSSASLRAPCIRATLCVLATRGCEKCGLGQLWPGGGAPAALATGYPL